MRVARASPRWPYAIGRSEPAWRPGGGQKREIRSGNVVWILPGVEHWHGATTTNGMTHIAIQEAVDGKVVNRLEQVEYGQYRD